MPSSLCHFLSTIFLEYSQNGRRSEALESRPNVKSDGVTYLESLYLCGWSVEVVLLRCLILVI